MKLNLLFTVILVCQVSILSQSSTDLIFFKNGEEIKCDITEVKQNLLIVENYSSSHLMLKSILEIRTTKNRIVDELKDNLENISVSNRFGYNIINLENATIPVVLNQEKSFYSIESIGCKFSPNKYFSAGFDIKIEFSALPILFTNLGASFGTQKGHKSFSNFNAEIGLGTMYSFDKFALVPQLKYVRVNGYNSETIEMSNEDLFFFDLTFRFHPGDDMPVYLFVGYEYNILETKSDERDNYNSVLLGFGYAF